MSRVVKRLTMLAVMLAALPLGVLAQTFVPRDPGSTVNTPDKPPANTPVPDHFQQSYQAYLKMKADAHGGTQYSKLTYGKMPDWSGFGHGTCLMGSSSIQNRRATVSMYPWGP